MTEHSDIHQQWEDSERWRAEWRTLHAAIDALAAHARERQDTVTYRPARTEAGQLREILLKWDNEARRWHD